MKFLSLFLLVCFSNVFFAQKTMDVKLILKYKNNPLCNWEVTIKHGDATIAKSKSNEQGEVVFRNATIYSLSIDAYGYKAFQGGDKKWDVKGYIQLNEQGFASFDFEPLVKEVGMPVSMLENAWGLTLNDCGSVGIASSSEQKSTPSNSTNTQTEKQSTPVEEQYSVQDMQQDMKQGMDNMKVMNQNKIANLTSKIDKKSNQRASMDPTSKEFSEISYDIKDLELEREITKVKLEKVDLQISKGYKPLNKAEREQFDLREDGFSELQKANKKSQKEGYFYGTSTFINKPVEKKEEPKVAPTSEKKEESKSGEKKEVSEMNEDKSETKNEKPVKEELIFYTESELAAMSVFNVKKYRVDCKTIIGRWKLTLTTKSSMLTPAQIDKYKAEIKQLEAEITLIDAELKKRAETKE